MSLLSKLFAKKEKSGLPTGPQEPPDKLVATVELKSPHLLAFDLPAEGVRYEIPGFSPGMYQIPLTAIIKATDSSSLTDGLIEVDTGVIYFIDAGFEDKFRTFEAQLFDDTGDTYSIVENPDQYTEQIGVKFDCFIAPGIDSGYDFEGDGVYKLDVSKITKI